MAELDFTLPSSKPDVYEVIAPKQRTPILLDIPHSGTILPKDFKYACRVADIRKTEDSYVDQLFADAANQGATVLKALFSRSYVDVNRAEDDIDPDLFKDPNQPRLNLNEPDMNLMPTHRAKYGSGVIRTICNPGVAIYNRPLKPAEVTKRIEKYYRPYHATLEELIKLYAKKFSKVLYISCHSTPSRLIKNKMGHEFDICLGDYDGQTCGKTMRRHIENTLGNLGYSISVNDPFKGVELIKKYAKPTRGIHCVQIEINRSLYMNEETLEKTKDFNKVQQDLNILVNSLVDVI